MTSFAITGVGIPLTHLGFAGFLSKDAIIESAYAGSGYAFWLLVIAACFTSFYSWRLIFLTFYGKPRGDHHAYDHAHESPPVMTIPLGVLAIGAVFAGMVWYGPFFGDHHKVTEYFHIAGAHHEAAEGGEAEHATAEAPVEHAVADTAEGEPTDEAAHAEVAAPVGGAIYMHPDNHIMDEAHHAPAWVKVSPFIAMVLGLITAWTFYIANPSLPRRLAAQQPALYRFLLNKWYFDEIYEAIFVRPAKWIGAQLWRRGDGDVIDGSLNGVAMGVIPMLTRLAGRAQSGYIFTYAFAMVVGVVILITWMTLTGGAE